MPNLGKNHQDYYKLHMSFRDRFLKQSSQSHTMNIMAYPFAGGGGSSPLFLLLLLFLVPLLAIIFKRSFLSKSPKLPPGPTPWPLIGNIHHIGKKMPHVSLANYAKIFGPIMSFRLGSKYLVVGSSPAAAMEILKKHDRSLSGRDPPRSFPYSRSELNRISIGFTEECNSRWKYLRALVRTELFSGKALESQECLRKEKVLEMVEFLRASEGNEVNIGQLAFATILNTLSNILLSRDLINLQDNMGDGSMKALMREIVNVLSEPNLSDHYPGLSVLDLQGLRKKAKKLWKQVWSILEPIVEEKRKRTSKAEQQDFLDILVEHRFIDDEILELLVELFNAGSDTSTSTIEWMMAELLQNTDAMKNLHEELERGINHDLIIESDIIKLPYLQACVKESLRLHPPAPLLLPHRAIDTCQIMGYKIPRNAQVTVNVWALGRDPTVWEEPLKFRPERFLSSPLDFTGNDFEFLPFGTGRRICPGYPMAARQVPLLIASLIHIFDWSLPVEKETAVLDMNEEFGVTMQKKHPLLLIPRARNRRVG